MSSVTELEMPRAKARYSRERVALLRAKHGVKPAACNSSIASCSALSDEPSEPRSRRAC